MTDSSVRQQHLFIVRIWHEPSQIAAPGQWRGSVEHTESGQRRYFIALGDMTEFMAAQLGEAQLDSRSETDPNRSMRSQAI